MARIRTIKPEFFTSENIVELSAFARILFIAIWCEADREGRLVWKPKTFKMRYLPADQLDIDSLCNELVKSGLVILYGKEFAYIPTFHKHQHINPREATSKLPDPDASSTREPRNLYVIPTRRKEGKGKEGKHSENDATNFEEFWNIYPKKVAKPASKKAWIKAEITTEDFSSLMKELETLKESEQWLTSDGKYIPNPANWITQRRWEDQIGGIVSNFMEGVI